ncbi:ribulose-bisphosphate carboxylase large subunit family protein [Pandoraea sp. XJJ-1]|uniref:ribulose-bisphosphate carboxylase large subunit family protein n=1 Tax=Pandoraea sp. XJJ-1 TaxID=3002643 RepID=UPI0022820BF8|nr:ribulose-bisphosphate carboxylase large subunit family protein [Pandoraea sp. XJJ-1]WAL84073.1 ribulose-bisphosphate carboxylase large subunit family protein [Pandoraea sp. XJJ-1]
MSATLSATYLIETPLDPRRVAEVMAGEQSCGTFTRVAGETDALRERARAVVEAVDLAGDVAQPSLPNAFLERKGIRGPWHRARVRIAFPYDNVGVNLPTLAATLAGNLYDLGEVTGMRLERIALPASYRQQFDFPRYGIAGTREATGVREGALVGTILKPNVGMSAAETAALVARLCAAGVDFIKDDEVCANPVHAPLAQRVPAVMAVVREHRARTGKLVMVAFNITDETDAMRRHADLVMREGGNCVMVSLNWCGFSAVQTLRRHTDLAIHAHRNGYGATSRDPMLGMGFQAYQTLWRLAGVDHMHVHGLQGKFAQGDEEVIESAHDCYAPLAVDAAEQDIARDQVMPAFSSGQWAGTVPATWRAVGRDDLLFMAGGGILAHPDGPAAGVQSLRDAWAAVRAGQSLEAASHDAPALAAALRFFGH